MTRDIVSDVRTAIALILILIGLAIAVYGFGGAVMELIGLYQGALTDPLAEPKVSERETSHLMIRSAIIGFVGIPPLLVGSILLKIGLFKRFRKRVSGYSGRL